MQELVQFLLIQRLIWVRESLLWQMKSTALEYLEVVGIPDSIGDPALEGKVRQVFREIINIKKENTAS